jgi:ferritin-like metal-binding protein YciE
MNWMNSGIQYGVLFSQCASWSNDLVWTALVRRWMPAADRQYASPEEHMGLFTTDIKTMDDLFLHGMRDIYYAENQIVKSLAKMIEKTTDKDLSAGLLDHLRETENQVHRLDVAFERLGLEPKGTSCPGIDGLIKEADGLAREVEDKIVLDAAIISSAQAIEHYEISRYDSLVGWAQQLGHHDVRELLQANFDEEKEAHRKLSLLDQAAALRGRSYTREQDALA